MDFNKFQPQAPSQAQPASGAPNLDEFIHRKLQPVKVLVALLQRELAIQDQEQVSLDRGNLENLVTTLELFIEDYERVSQVKSKRPQKLSSAPALVDAAKQKHYGIQVKAA